jgi:hypothetical protein
MNSTIRTSKADPGMPRQRGAYIRAFTKKKKGGEQEEYIPILKLKIYFDSKINKDSGSKINARQT